MVRRSKSISWYEADSRGGIVVNEGGTRKEEMKRGDKESRGGEEEFHDMAEHTFVRHSKDLKRMG